MEETFLDKSSNMEITLFMFSDEPTEVPPNFNTFILYCFTYNWLWIYILVIKFTDVKGTEVYLAINPKGNNSRSKSNLPIWIQIQ